VEAVKIDEEGRREPFAGLTRHLHAAAGRAGDGAEAIIIAYVPHGRSNRHMFWPVWKMVAKYGTITIYHYAVITCSMLTIPCSLHTC